MAAYMFQVRMQGPSNLPEDVYENVLFYEVNAPDTVAGTCDEIQAKYLGVGAGEGGFFAGWNTCEVRAYELAGGQPIHQTAPLGPAKSTAVGPREVALCLSYAALDDPDAATARRRGRIFLGPLKASDMADRPPSGLLTSALAFGQSLAAIGTAGNTTWLLYSRTDLSTHKIESIWVDNAWDTQRRRGNAPTTRTVEDVQ